jgi:FAD/FMN-containing dehydrogenase
VLPELVVFPKDKGDIKALVNFVRFAKKDYLNLSLTPRSGGTDMSGGPIGESIILDVSKHITGVLSVLGNVIKVLPGTFYRDFEKVAKEHGLLLPSYPASRNICTVVGMVSNNSAGEKTLVYGQTKQYVKELKVIFQDGNEYTVRPLSRRDLEAKIAEDTFEGHVYKSLYTLIEANKTEIQNAKPKTAKNAAGYYLWDVWDGETFDVVKLFCGSQGTLGIITEITFELVPLLGESRMLAIHINDLKKIPDVVSTLLPYKPSSIESFDDQTGNLAIHFLPDVILGHGYSLWQKIKLFFSFFPEFYMYANGTFPKLTMMVEFEGNDALLLEEKIKSIRTIVKEKKFSSKIVRSKTESLKFWSIRRESYNLLRKHGLGKEVASFIEDVVVPTEHLFEFLPRLNELLHSYDLTYSIAGHAGSGNFHIFPLMDFNDQFHKEKIIEISHKVYALVTMYGGSITAEHNDGISRTPFLHYMFSERILTVFEGVKKIFDVQNIFNPHKKVHCEEKFFKEHIR